MSNNLLLWSAWHPWPRRVWGVRCEVWPVTCITPVRWVSVRGDNSRNTLQSVCRLQGIHNLHQSEQILNCDSAVCLCRVQSVEENRWNIWAWNLHRLALHCRLVTVPELTLTESKIWSPFKLKKKFCRVRSLHRFLIYWIWPHLCIDRVDVSGAQPASTHIPPPPYEASPLPAYDWHSRRAAIWVSLWCWESCQDVHFTTWHSIMSKHAFAYQAGGKGEHHLGPHCTPQWESWGVSQVFVFRNCRPQ